jgi:hypothetical protein
VHHRRFLKGSRQLAAALVISATGLLVASPVFAANATKEMQELGLRVAAAQACGVPASAMQGVSARYSEALNLLTVRSTGALHSAAESQTVVTANDLTLAFMQGGQLVGEPTAKDCLKIKKKWPKYDREQAKKADRDEREISRRLGA